MAKKTPTTEQAITEEQAAVLAELRVVGEKIAAVEALRPKRIELMNKAHDLGLMPTVIAEAGHTTRKMVYLNKERREAQTREGSAPEPTRVGSSQRTAKPSHNRA